MEVYSRGDIIIACNKRTKEVFTFKCPHNDMCKAALTRYCIVELNKGVATDRFIFTKE